MIAMVGLLALLTGVAIGWYLRRINSWCPQCGDHVTCASCGERPILSVPARSWRGR
jgi:hypothetical protein